MNIELQRKLFEKWHSETIEGYDDENDLPVLARDWRGYCDSDTHERWLVWQAAIAAYEGYKNGQGSA